MDTRRRRKSRGLFLHKGGCAYLGSVEGAVEAYLGSVDVQADGLVDLTNHAGRPSGMHSILRGVGIRVPGSSAYTNRLKTGDDLELEIRYDTGPDFIDLAQLGFCSITGMRLFTVGTHLAPDFNPVLRGVGVLTCRVPALPLVGGEYSISIMIGQGTPPHNLDCVDHAIRFHVETADYFGTGRTPLPSQGFWAQKADWRVEEGTRGLT